MTIIGMDLPKSKDGAQINPNVSAIPPMEDVVDAAAKAKKYRPFRFDDTQETGGKFSIKGKELRVAGLAILGVMVAFAGYSVLSKTNGDAQTIPFSKSKVVESKLTSVSGIQVDSSMQAASAPAIAGSAPGLATAIQEPSAVASAPQVAEPSPDTAKLQKPAEKPEEARAVQAEPVVLPTIEHFQVALLIKQIDEKKVLVEYSGKEYLVKPGQRLPGGETVFVGFDKRESIMRTTAGDHRIFMR